MSQRLRQRSLKISPVQFNDSADRRCEGRDNECGDANTCSEGYCLDGEGNRVQIPFHVGFGLAQQYMEQALLGFHQGGALCIKVGAELSELISSGTLSLLMPSINELIAGHQPSPAPMRLELGAEGCAVTRDRRWTLRDSRR